MEEVKLGLRRWLVENFPDLEEPVSTDICPAVTLDYLCVDVKHMIENSMITADRNDYDQLFLTYDDVINYTLHYLETVQVLLKPTKCMFVCLPGVEPRCAVAKSRSLAYMNAVDREKLLEDVKVQNDSGTADLLDVPDKPFDVNCALPGTEFMYSLQKHLEYWIADKLSNDKEWQKLEVIISGQDVPGESRQKVADFIRRQTLDTRLKEEHRVGIFSNDDFMLLHALSLSLDKLCINVYSGRGPEVNPERKSYRSLDTEKVRHCLVSHLKSIFNTSPDCNFSFDAKKVCKDALLLCTLADNSYRPHLPFFFSFDNSLGRILDCYRSSVPYLKGYLVDTEDRVNFVNLQAFFDRLSKLELEIFTETKFKAVKEARDKLVNSEGFDRSDSEVAARKEIYGFMYEDGPVPPDSENDTEFEFYRRGYYQNVCQYSNENGVNRSALAVLKTLAWQIDSLFGAISSWEWAYPFQLSPFVSDIKDADRCVFTFEQKSSLQVFAYLLCVVPIQSNDLLPEPVARLQTESSIAQQFSRNYEIISTDCDSHRHEMVVKFPPLVYQDVIPAYDAAFREVSVTDKLRNHRGQILVYHSSDKECRMFVSTLDVSKFPNIQPCFTKVLREDILLFRPDRINRSQHGSVVEQSNSAPTTPLQGPPRPPPMLGMGSGPNREYDGPPDRHQFGTPDRRPGPRGFDRGGHRGGPRFDSPRSRFDAPHEEGRRDGFGSPRGRFDDRDRVPRFDERPPPNVDGPPHEFRGPPPSGEFRGDFRGRGGRGMDDRGRSDNHGFRGHDRTRGGFSRGPFPDNRGGFHDGGRGFQGNRGRGGFPDNRGRGGFHDDRRGGFQDHRDRGGFRDDRRGRY